MTSLPSGPAEKVSSAARAPPLSMKNGAAMARLFALHVKARS